MATPQIPQSVSQLESLMRILSDASKEAWSYDPLKAMDKVSIAEKIALELGIQDVFNPICTAVRCLSATNQLSIMQPDRAEVDAMTIYFLKRPDGHIKIGRASNVNVRKKALEKSSGHKLMILGTMKSGIETEDSLHRRFNAQRGIGEWFAPSVELLDFISKSTSH